MLDDQDKAAVHQMLARNFPGHNIRVEHALKLKTLFWSSITCWVTLMRLT